MTSNLPKKTAEQRARLRAKRAVRHYGDHTAPKKQHPRSSKGGQSR